MAYVPPHPTFQVTTHSVIQNEGDGPQSVGVNITLAHLHATGADIKYWVTGDDALSYWPSLPEGTFHVSGNGTYIFNLDYTADTTPHLDASFTLNFYPANDITMVSYGYCTVTILDDDSPYDGDDTANTIVASAGDDVVNARGGDDIVHAAKGNDLVSGGLGNDSLYGGGGADYLRGDSGDNSLYGGNGKDTLIGSDGNDTIYGGGGNDMIVAGAGTNVVDGGAGNDSLDVGGSGNLLTGGTGADSFTFHWAAFGNEVTDFQPGTDRIAISLSDWHIAGATFQNKAVPTGDGPEFFFDPSSHTLYYTPLAPGDDGGPYTAYAVAVLDGVDSLSRDDILFVS